MLVSSGKPPRYHSLNKINCYLGFGPEFGFNTPRLVDILGETGIDQSYEWEQYYWNLTFGLQGMIGIEYALNSYLGVYGEYSTSLRYLHAWYEHEDDESALDMFQLESNPIRFGVSLYF